MSLAASTAPTWPGASVHAVVSSARVARALALAVSATLLGCTYLDPSSRAASDMASDTASDGVGDQGPASTMTAAMTRFRCQGLTRYALTFGALAGRLELRLSHLVRGAAESAEICLGHASEPTAAICRPLYGPDGTFPVVWTVDVRQDVEVSLGRADAGPVLNDCATDPEPRSFVRFWSPDGMEATLWARRIGDAAGTLP